MKSMRNIEAEFETIMLLYRDIGRDLENEIKRIERLQYEKREGEESGWKTVDELYGDIIWDAEQLIKHEMANKIMHTHHFQELFVDRFEPKSAYVGLFCTTCGESRIELVKTLSEAKSLPPLKRLEDQINTNAL